MRTPFFLLRCEFLELPAAPVDNPLAQGFNAIVVGERLYKVLGLAAFNKIAPHHFVFAVQSEVFFNCASRPDPNALLAKFIVDIADGAFCFGHRCHHCVCRGCADIAVLVDGETVYQSQMVVASELAEQVAALRNVRVVGTQESVVKEHVSY